jgi:hypothetical protein
MKLLVLVTNKSTGLITALLLSKYVLWSTILVEKELTRFWWRNYRSNNMFLFLTSVEYCVFIMITGVFPGTFNIKYWKE